MFLFWKNTNLKALPDFKYFNLLYEQLPCSKYVTISDWKKLKNLHDLASEEIINYEIKLRTYLKIINADFAENKTKSANKSLKTMNGKRKKMFDKKDIENIKNLKKQKVSNREIAKKYHCSEKTIRNYLIK